MKMRLVQCDGAGALRRPLLLVFLLALLLGRGRPVLAACDGVTNVATEGALNAAIADFNVQVGPCSYTIALTTDITLTASTTTIANANAGVDLLIDGQGQAIDGQGAFAVRPLTMAAGTHVTLANVTVMDANSIGFGGGIYNEGAR